MTPSREADAKSTARGNWKAIITRCMKNDTRCLFIIKCVGRLLKYELSKHCSNNCESVLRSGDADNLMQFIWCKMHSEVKQNMPHLLTILTMCTETPKKRQNSEAIIYLIIAILAKHRRPQASLVQKIISLLLYAGHCSKSVRIRLFAEPTTC